MKDKSVRILLLFVLLGVAALVVRQCTSDKPPEPGPASPAQDEGDPGTAFDPLGGTQPVADNTLQPAKPPAAMDEDPLPRREVGPLLEDGTVVPLQLTWVPGTESRYRITNASSSVDRRTNAATGQRFFTEVSLRVEGVTPAGAVRVRFVMDSIRVQMLLPNGMAVDFDSRRPDARQLEDANMALALKPMLAVIGLPLEFQLGPNGGPVSVDGLDRWTEAWAEVVDDLDPGLSRRISTPYATETMLLEWSELLFPPVLGGELAAGQDRDAQILRDTGYRTYVECRGPLRATHDDGEVFRVRMQATPAKLPRMSQGHSAQERAIEQTHIQANKNAYHAAWRFQRNPARLVDSEIDIEHQLWVSWNVGEGAGGIGEGVGSEYAALFLNIERKTRVELLSD